MPEALAAVRAARANRLQDSLNLGLGSALASIGLTIPAVAIVALWLKIPLTLGINPENSVLLALSLFLAVLTIVGNLLADVLYAWADPRIRVRS